MGKYAQTNYDNAITRDNLLSMLFTRLSLAKELLREDGVIFCSIDDRNQAYVKGLFDEVFGEGNFVANLCVELSTTQGMKVAAAQKGQIVKNAEYILCYAKNVENFSFQRPLYTAKEWDDHYSVYIDPETKKRTTLLEFLKNKYPSITKQKIKELYNGDKDFRDYIHANAKDVYRDAMIDINFNFTKKQEEAIENGDIVSYKEYLIFKTTTGIIRQLLPLEKAIGETDDFESTFGLRKIRGDWWEGYYKDMMNINKEGDVIFKNGKKPKRLIKDLLKLATTPANNGGGGGNSLRIA
ncbi:DNA methyltransferase [Campylobacter helveticus]|nr:DNA methyltransferase [Campylobacter helveticus]